MLNRSLDASLENKYIALIKEAAELKHWRNLYCEEVLLKMREYIKKIEEWGKSHNIVSSSYSRIDILQNIYDSLAGGEPIGLSGEVFDVGSGGGFPAIPLAIIYPEVQFFLVESSRKKCSFLRLARSALALKNVTVINQRVEELTPKSTVISKAAFSPANLKALISFCAPLGLIALWATPKSQEEVIKAAQSHGARLERTHNYAIPHSGQRCILVFRREQ